MANKPVIVALTGGIGSGKSAVARLFESWGAAVVDADILAREVVKPGSDALQQIATALSGDVLLADGSLDRAAVGALVFKDPAKKKKLESILHPLIRRLWLQEMERLTNSGANLIVYVIPLFFESRTEMPELNTVVLVTAPEDLRIRRIMDRDGLSAEAARLRIAAQLPDSVKRERSDHVIENDSTLEELTLRARKVFDSFSR